MQYSPCCSRVKDTVSAHMLLLPKGCCPRQRRESGRGGFKGLAGRPEIICSVFSINDGFVQGLGRQFVAVHRGAQLSTAAMAARECCRCRGRVRHVNVVPRSRLVPKISLFWRQSASSSRTTVHLYSFVKVQRQSCRVLALHSLPSGTVHLLAHFRLAHG